MSKESRARYHERKAEEKKNSTRWSSHYDDIREGKAHERIAKSLRDDIESEDDDSSRSSSSTPLTEEEKKKRKEERKKRWKRQKRSRLSKMIGNVEVEKENELPTSTDELEGFPEDPITDESEELIHEAELLLREEIEKLINDYHRSARRKARWNEERKKNNLRRTHTDLYIGNNTKPIQDEDFDRVNNNPDKVRKLVSNYVDAITDRLEEIERQKIFETFDFRVIDGIGPSKAEALDDARSNVEGTTVRKRTLKIRELKPKMSDLLDYLQLQASAGTHKLWKEYEGIGPSTLEKLEEVIEAIDELFEE